MFRSETIERRWADTCRHHFQRFLCLFLLRTVNACMESAITADVVSHRKIIIIRPVSSYEKTSQSPLQSIDNCLNKWHTSSQLRKAIIHREKSMFCFSSRFPYKWKQGQQTTQWILIIDTISRISSDSHCLFFSLLVDILKPCHRSRLLFALSLCVLMRRMLPYSGDWDRQKHQQNVIYIKSTHPFTPSSAHFTLSVYSVLFSFSSACVERCEHERRKNSFHDHHKWNES